MHGVLPSLHLHPLTTGDAWNPNEPAQPRGHKMGDPYRGVPIALQSYNPS